MSVCVSSDVEPQLLLPDFPVWDAHFHVHSLPGHPWDSPPERALRLMDPFRVERAAIMPYSEIDMASRQMLQDAAEQAQAYPGRFLLFARLHPKEGGGAEELLEWAVQSLGYVGLKLHPVGSRIHPTHALTKQLVRRAALLGVPTLFHCGDEALTLPDDIGPLAEAVPEASILLGHCGGYFHTASALEWAKRCPNLYLETSACPHVDFLRRALDELGPHRLLWGSDGPGCVPVLELHKQMLSLKGHPGAEPLVFRDNLKRLLRLDEGGGV